MKKRENKSRAGQRKPIGGGNADKAPGDGIELESERGHEIVDFVIDECGMLYRRSVVIRHLMQQFNLSRAQAYRYYDHAWKIILEKCNTSHEEKTAEAREMLTSIANKANAQKRYDIAMAAMDRRNLIDKVSNPTTNSKLTILHGDAPVDEALSDGDLEAVIAGAKSAKTDPNAGTKSSPSSGDSAKAPKGKKKPASVPKGNVS